MTEMPSSILQKILDGKNSEIAELKKRFSEEDIRAAAFAAPPARSFMSALGRGEKPRVIAEIKKASPSQGVLREDFDPVLTATQYERGGAAAVSVLTDKRFFQGDIKYLSGVREAVSVPVLRKDFLTDPCQIYESRAAGADTVLLIVAAMKGAGQLADLIDLSRSLEMEPLVEVHNEEEVEIALRADASVIGVNNRDLGSFEVDLSTSARLAPLIGKDKVVVAESGITSPDDMTFLAQEGIFCFLIGESLIKEPDPGAALSGLIQEWRKE